MLILMSLLRIWGSTYLCYLSHSPLCLLHSRTFSVCPPPPPMINPFLMLYSLVQYFYFLDSNGSHDLYLPSSRHGSMLCRVHCDGKCSCPFSQGPLLSNFFQDSFYGKQLRLAGLWMSIQNTEVKCMYLGMVGH